MLAAGTWPRETGGSSRLSAVSSIPAGDDVLDPEEPTYDLPHVARLLGVPVTKVHQHLGDRDSEQLSDAGKVVDGFIGV